MLRYLFLLVPMSLLATDWLMVQGTQNPSAPAHNFWGFGQLRVTHNTGTVVETGGINKTPFSYNKPSLERQTTLDIARLRLGLRGRLDSQNTVNYFLLTEFGTNGITQPAGHYFHTYITDYSLTFKQLPLYVRAGKFKYPGSEEGFMARFVSPFINFTAVTDQLLLERFIDHGTQNGTTYTDTPAHSVGAYRDTGVQLFASTALSGRDKLSYAYMLGSGNGLRAEYLNDAPTHYGYLAYEHSLGGGKGYYAQAFKLFAWAQRGKRKVGGTLYERNRQGTGLTYYRDGLRFQAEYMEGEGMIFTGAKDQNPAPTFETWYFQMEASKSAKARGYYLASIYEPVKDLALLARYDRYDRLYNDNAKARLFTTTTAGVSYRFDRFNRLDFNYARQQIDAPHNAAAQAIVDNAGNLATLQLTAVFR